MSYRNKTYVIFDGDTDMWAYGFMLGWKSRDHMDFDFHDAHAVNTITDRANEESVKRKLRERFQSAKQAIVLIGEHTKNLFRFVRWEMEVAQELGLPIVAVNLNQSRRMDADRCPAILRDESVVHVSFKMAIIKHALDNFCSKTPSIRAGYGENLYYKDKVYEDLDIED